jgi:hypothetical protein
LKTANPTRSTEEATTQQYLHILLNALMLKCSLTRLKKKYYRTASPRQIPVRPFVSVWL